MNTLEVDVASRLASVWPALPKSVGPEMQLLRFNNCGFLEMSGIGNFELRRGFFSLADATSAMRRATYPRLALSFRMCTGS